MAISANLVHLYVSMAGKCDFLKFLLLLLCCLYCVVVLFRMLLLGPRCSYRVLTLYRIDQLVFFRVGIAACQPRDIYIYIYSSKTKKCVGCSIDPVSLYQS